VQLVGALTSTPGYFSLLLQYGVLQSGNPLLPAWYPVIFDPQFSPVVGRGLLLLSALHRTVFGESLTWTVRVGPQGTWVTLPLQGWDGLDWWVGWLLAPGAYPRGPLLPFLIGVVLAGYAAVIAVSARRLWAVLGPPPRPAPRVRAQARSQE
jgi:hypothetical protein